MLAHTHKTQNSPELPVAVVAGGAGFLGATLCETLLTQNCQVIAIDNLKTGKLENLQNCEGKHNFFFIEGDINKELPALPKNISYIFHLAGVEEYINGLDISLDTLLVNSLGTRNLLEVAHERNAKFLLASTLEIFQAIFSSWSLKKNLGIGEAQSQAFSHHEAKRYAEAITTEYYKKFDLDTRIIRLLDVYGPKMDLEAGTEIALILKGAIEKNEIAIHGDGLKSLHPTFVTDVVYGITKAMFARESKGKIFTLVNPKSVSVLNVAYEVQKQLNNKPKVEFIESKNEPPELERDSEMEIEKTTEELGWHPKVDYEEGLAQTLNFFLTPGEKTQTHEEGEGPNVITIGEEPQEARQIKKIDAKLPKIFLPKIKIGLPHLHIPKKKVILPLTFLIVAALLLIYPPVSLLISTKEGIASLKKTRELATQGKLEEAANEIEKSNKAFTVARSKIDGLGLHASLLGKKKLRNEATLLLDLAVKGTSAGKHLMLSINPMIKIAQGIDKSANVNIRESLSYARLELEKGSDEVGEVLAEVKKNKIDTSIWPLNAYKKDIDSFSEQLPTYQAFLSKAKTMSLLLPELIGLNGKRIYLLLFQNNMELRPAGGFIGSYGLVSVSDGKISDLKIEDVYTADGNLKGKIFPPGPITKYMGQPSWYLRDSNWSPDFKTSAEKAEYFLEKETGELVDGVIAIDINTITEILKAIGPIALPEYKETISAENLYEKTQIYSEKDFFPGSTQKKDFLGTLNQRLMSQLLQSPQSKWLALIGGLIRSLNEKHIQANFHDLNLQKLITEFGYDGGVTIFTPGNSDCLSLGVTCDFLQVVEANLGANKANYFTDRSFFHEIVFGRGGEIEEKITVKYNNKSPNNAWPAGPYKNYLRVYVPQNSLLTRIDLDDKKASISAHLDTEKPKNIKEGELDVEIATESAKTSFGFFIEIPPLTQKTVSVSYRLPYNLSFSKDDTTYRFYWQKQAGTDKDPILLTINYPSFYKVGKQDPPATLTSQSVKYQTTLDTNKKFSIEISK